MNINNLEESIKKGSDELKNIDATPFTNSGFDYFKIKIEEYIKALFLESIKSSKRDDVDMISIKHIDSASKFLHKSSRLRFQNFYLSIGGLLLGSCISNLFSMTMLGASFNILGMSLTIIFGIIGAFLLGKSLFDN